MQIMVREHNMLHRQALILRAATFPLNDKDRQRLKVSLFHNLWLSACSYSSLAQQVSVHWSKLSPPVHCAYTQWTG